MSKQFVVLIVLVLALVAVVACAPAAPATQQGPSDEQAAAPASNAQQEASTEGATAAAPPDQDVSQAASELTKLCVVFPTLDGTGQQFTSRGAENGDLLAMHLDMSHGEAVFETIVDTISDTKGLSPDNSDPGLITSPDLYRDVVVVLVVDNFKKPSATVDPDLLPMMALYQSEGILIAGVDIGSWEMDQVYQNIQAAMNAFIGDPDDRTVTKFVINMSFALVPCDGTFQATLDDYWRGAIDFASLSDNLMQLVKNTYDGDHLAAQASTENSLFYGSTKCLASYDPIEGQSCDQVKFPSGTSIILVGAAGNSGYAFAFAPALWNTVVSASASDGSGNKASYSNTGEVMMPGTTRHTGVEVTMDDGTTELLDVVGTSFASPRLALEEALYLRDITNASEGISCEGDAQVPASPPLGYIPEAFDWNVANDGIDANNDGIFEHQADLPLPEAKARYCNP